jgi:hypothetical protein
MHCLIHTVPALALGLVGIASTASTVSVSFNPDAQYADAGISPRDRQATLATLSAHLKRVAERRLPADEALEVELLDVDLAGTVRPSRRTGTDLRGVRGSADWPRLTLRYSLSKDGRVLRSGTESIADMNYSGRLGNYLSGDPLRYEKQLLDDWVGRLAQPQAGAR